MFKTAKIYFLLFLSILLWSLFIPTAQAADLSAVSLNVNPLTSGALSTWTISFTIPQDTKLGHILISLGGYQPDLGSAELFVSGIPNGNPQVGKSNPNCVFNCDDIRYYYTNPISVKKGTKITFTLNKVKNSSKVGSSGINFINVFSSKYPEMTLAFSSGAQSVNLVESVEPVDDTLLPPSATNEAPEVVSDLAKVQLNELFFQPGSKTTKFAQIKDPTKVEDLTLDVIGKEKIVFNGILDLSKPEAIKFFQSLGDYLTFEKLSFEVKKELMDFFKVSLEITYYDLPYVWDPDILKNDTEVLSKDKMENYHYVIYDNKPQVSFTINEAGKYQLIPHLEVNIQDNQKITNANPLVTFTARISDPKAVVTVDLNGTEQKDIDIKIDQAKGEFSMALTLIPGTNLIQIEAKSEFGAIAKVTKTVEYISSAPADSDTEKESGLSPFNIAAIVLAVLATLLLWIIKRMAKKRR
jgi:hypothetical protein